MTKRSRSLGGPSRSAKRRLGREHEIVDQSLSALAELYLIQGRYDKVEPLFRRALAFREKSFEPGHASVARTLYILAAIYGSQGHYGKAEPLLMGHYRFGKGRLRLRRFSIRL
jgi:hypothetical protein